MEMIVNRYGSHEEEPVSVRSNINDSKIQESERIYDMTPVLDNAPDLSNELTQ